MKSAFTPLNCTVAAPAKLNPIIVTVVPTGPLVGEKLLIIGAPTTVKLLELVAVPKGVVTLIGPVVAPAGTVAVILVLELTVKLEFAPPNATTVAPVKFVPLIVTLVPTEPLVGVKLVIVGEAAGCRSGPVDFVSAIDGNHSAGNAIKNKNADHATPNRKKALNRILPPNYGA